MAVWCERVGLLLQFVTNLFYKRKNKIDGNCLLYKLLISFSDLFFALLNLNSSTLNTMSDYLLKMLSPLFQENCVFLASGK